MQTQCLPVIYVSINSKDILLIQMWSHQIAVRSDSVSKLLPVFYSNSQNCSKYLWFYLLVVLQNRIRLPNNRCLQLIWYWLLTDSWSQTAQIARLQRIKHKQRVTINLHSNITDSNCLVRAPKLLWNSSISQLAFDNKKMLSSTALRTFIYINAFGPVQ